MTDGALAVFSVFFTQSSSFSVFFTQSSSFLAFQRDMEQKKQNSNARTLFKVEQIPSDQQIRNVLDPVSPTELYSEYWWAVNELATSDHLDSYRCLEETVMIAMDGVTYHSSTQIHCERCQQRRDNQGTVHYCHRAIAPSFMI
ncbi:MAG: hypothetical protein R6W76_05400 [Caldilinea sp.]